MDDYNPNIFILGCNVAHYDIFYGSISNIIILLIWFYILSYVFVIGLVMNAGIDKGNIENNIKG